MFLLGTTFLLMVGFAFAAQPVPKEKQSAVPLGRQLPFAPFPNQNLQFPYPNEAQYDPFLNTQLQYGGFIPNFQQEAQSFPGQPQIVFYQGGTGQPVLINPGNPPGNFLVPQGFPQQPQGFPQQPQGFPQGIPQGIPQGFPQVPQGVPQGFPQSFPQQPGFDQNSPNPPVFIAGYPKPAHIPPIDKDAEEIPTDPKQIPQQKPAGKKPEKIELDESEPEKPESGKSEPKRPKTPIRNLVNLRPGQRFFFLNGQPLLQNYPILPNPNFERYNQLPPFLRGNPQFQGPFKNLFPGPQPLYLRNDGTGQIAAVQQIVQNQENLKSERQGILLRDALPLQLQNQYDGKKLVPVLIKKEVVQDDSPQNLQSRYSEKRLPLENQEQPLPIYEGNVNPGIAYDYYRYNDDHLNDNDAVVIDAKVRDNYEQTDGEAEEVEADTEKPAESSVAQAQPGAIALAGVGGVAAAGPRGTALAGEGGLAVSSPHATAVAGPSKDEATTEEKKSTIKKSKKIN